MRNKISTGDIGIDFRMSSAIKAANDYERFGPKANNELTINFHQKSTSSKNRINQLEVKIEFPALNPYHKQSKMHNVP